MDAVVALIIAFAAACAASSPPTKPKPTPMTPAPASIGSATMQADGTIVLQLRAEGAHGEIGDAQLYYPPDHAQYQSILAHLGGLKPGETKPVAPWN